jgi:hypothetical protein
MNTAERELSQNIKSLKQKIYDHMNSYQEHIQAELKELVETLAHDFPEGVSIEDLKNTFLDSYKISLKDTIDEMFSDNLEINSAHEFDEIFDELREATEGHLKSDTAEDDETLIHNLQELSEKYHLTDQPYYLEQIRYVLKDEFNLPLDKICGNP